MAGLDVDRVETGFPRKLRRRPEFLLQRFEVIVRDDTAVGSLPELLQIRMSVGDHRRGNISRVGIAPAVVCLQDQKRCKAVGFPAGLLHIPDEPLIGIQILLADKELRRGRPALLDHRDGFEPDDRSASNCLLRISSERIRRRRAVRRGVRAFHRRNSQAVFQRDPVKCHGFREHGRILRERKMHSELRGFCLYVFRRLIMKFLVCHGDSS